MGNFLYELRPYYCLALAALGLTATETLGKIFALLLAYCGVRIWMWRKTYRSNGLSSLRS